MRRLPDAVYIGMQKTGSTYLRSYFSQHPQIAWTRHAPRFQLHPFDAQAYLDQFAQQGEPACLLDMYEGLSLGYHLGQAGAWNAADAVEPGAPLGERCMVPAAEEIAERIAGVLPKARILITLRNQVDWLRSNYLHYMLHLPKRRRGFTDFLTTREGKLLLAAGNYDQVLALYHRRFGEDRVHVILLEDLATQEDRILRGLCEFLGVAFHPFDKRLADRNTGMGPGRGTLVRAYSRLGISDTTARRLRPWFKPVENLVSSRMQTATLTRQEEEMIRSVFAVSNCRTAHILGRDIASLGYTY